RAANRRAAMIESGRRTGSDLAYLLTRRFSFAGPVPPSLVDFMERMVAHTHVEVMTEFFDTFLDHDKLASLGELNRVPTLMLFGEAPGAQEDATGRPFVGKAGQLLDRLLAEAGLDRSEIAVANVLKCRPPGNRPPARDEIARCRGWLDRQVALVDPELVVT